MQDFLYRVFVKWSQIPELYNAFWNFIGTEYIFIIGFTVFMIVLFADISITKATRRKLSILCLLSILYSLVSYIDYTIGFSQVHAYTDVRFAAATMGYILRPALMALAIPTLISAKITLTSHFYYVPLAINTAIYLINIPTHICFYITPENTYYSGNLRFFSVAVCAIYMVICIIMIVIHQKNEPKVVRMVTLLILSILVVCSIAEIQGQIMLLSETILICLILYYLLTFVLRSNEALKLKEKELDFQKDALMLSQIHPHFIYNTLNAIYYLCQVNPEQAGETILKFSDYLRENLDLSNSEKELTSVEQELNHTRMYSDIERLRFPKLTVEYDINDGGYYIPPLTIEPLVENAIRHGVRGLDNGLVRVSLYLEKGYHIIKVEDNGAGMDPAAIKLGERKGIGLDNVRERLKRLCNGSLEIKSSPGEGTTILIEIDSKFYDMGGHI